METARALPTHIDTSGKAAVVRGTDIKVSLIASEYDHLGMGPDDIAQAHPQLSLADVHAALAYYYDQAEEIRREWREGELLVAALRSRYSSRLAGRSSRP